MARQPKHDWTVSAALLLCRIAQGLFFFLSGLSKVRGQGTPLSNLSLFIDSHMGNWPDWIPPRAIQTYGYFLPLIELSLGVFLVLGLGTRVVAGIMVLVAMTMLLFAGGDFGDSPLNPYVIMIALALLIASTGPGQYSLDQKARK